MVSGSNFIPLPFHLFKFAITYERFWIFLRTLVFRTMIMTLALIS
jgi:hypothetical protein